MSTIRVVHGTGLHDDIINRLKDIVTRSRDRRTNDILRFDLADQVADCSVAIPAEEVEEARNSSRPTYRTIKVSYSYAVMMAELTYEATVFLARDPIFQVEGQTPEAVDGEMALETYLQYQLRHGGAIPYLYQAIRDSLQYSQAIVGICWEDSQTTIASLYNDTTEGKKKLRTVEADVFTFLGNRVYGVRPHDFIFDPIFSFATFQKGGYCGEFSTAGRETVLRGFSDDSYIKENKKAFEESNVKSGFLYRWENTRGSNQEDEIHPLAGRFDDDLDSHYGRAFRDKKGDQPYACEILDLYVKLIPKEWGLTKSDRMSIWQFRVANGEVILSVRPCDNLHGQFPYAVKPGDIDLYRVSPISPLERAMPFEETMNWLINSHFYNVRQHLNNRTVVDPSRIMIQDMVRRHPSGMIRVKPEAYGQEVRNAIYQLQLGDVTGQHLNDMRVVEEIGQKVLGTNDNVLGQVHPGGRKTATEVRTSTSFSTNRLKVAAEYGSSLFWSQIAAQMISNTKQYLDAEMHFRVTSSNEARRFTTINPDVIASSFLYKPVDGTLPIDRMGQSQVMGQLFQQLLSAAPYKYDGDKMLRYLAELLGARNIPLFELTPDEQLQRQIAAGNSVPLSQTGGQGGGPQEIPGGAA